MEHRRRRALLLVATSILVLLGLAVWTTGPLGAGHPVLPPAPPIAVEPGAPRAAPAPAADPDPPLPHTVAAGHARLAGALGLAAVRCWVGPELDTDDLVGAYHQRIEGGWYSNVVTTPSGRTGVERRFVDDDADPGPSGFDNVDFETLFFVGWEGAEPGATVPCVVQWPRYAELTVLVVDTAGAPVEGATVYGCTGDTTDAAGTTELRPFAGEGCTLRAFTPYEAGGPPMARGSVEVAALEEHERRAVTVTVSSARPAVSDAEPPDPAPRAFAEPDLGRELEVMRGLLTDAEGSELDLLERLIRHREELVVQEAARAAARAELDDLMERMSRGEGDPLALKAEMDEVMKRLTGRD